ncbi:MAG TPA: HTTM domain-containing protein [Balneolaceae bacterium]|nr:HTTM domain-containing protein [Balneolaceae bacterium]
MKIDRFSRWIFNSYSPSLEGLALFRIFTALMFLFFLMPDASYYSDLANFPDDFFSPPPGPMMLIDSFPEAWFFYIVHLFLIVSWLGILFGYKSRVSSLMAGVFMLILLGFIFSIGKVNHQMLLVLLPVIMAFSNWGEAYSIDARRADPPSQAEGWPLVLLALFVGFMMFTAGFPKILGGWLDGDTLATKGHLLNQYFVRGRTELLSGFMVDMNVPWVWSLLDWATVIFETGFLVAVLRAGWTRLFVCFAVLFHFSTMLTLNIAFLVNFPAYAAFLPWRKIHNYISPRLSSESDSINVALIYGAVLTGIFTIIKIIDKNDLILQLSEPSFDDLAIIGTALVIVIALGVRKAKSLIISVRS